MVTIIFFNTVSPVRKAKLISAVRTPHSIVPSNNGEKEDYFVSGYVVTCNHLYNTWVSVVACSLGSLFGFHFGLMLGSESKAWDMLKLQLYH